MQQRANFFDESIERVQGEVDKLQKGFEKRRKQIEKDAEKRVNRLRSSQLGKRVVALREDAAKQFETNMENFMKLLPVASNAAVKRLERKVNTLSRKVTELERSKVAGVARKVESAAQKVEAAAK